MLSQNTISYVNNCRLHVQNFPHAKFRPFCSGHNVLICQFLTWWFSLRYTRRVHICVWLYCAMLSRNSVKVGHMNNIQRFHDEHVFVVFFQVWMRNIFGEYHCFKIDLMFLIEFYLRIRSAIINLHGPDQYKSLWPLFGIMHTLPAICLNKASC